MSAIDTIRRDDNDTLARRSLNLRTLTLATIGFVDRMLERRRSRIALLELSDEQLKDIGISRADAWREGVRPFWN